MRLSKTASDQITPSLAGGGKALPKTVAKKHREGKPNDHIQENKYL
jgi:hypothetical protein